MTSLLPFLLVLPALSLLALGGVPRRLAIRNSLFLGRMAIVATSASVMVSLLAAGRVIGDEPIDWTFVQWKSPVPFCLGLHVDAITVVMMSLISFIGMVIARYSMRYLLGDPMQGEFFRWMSVTVGATLVLVMSCNLVMLTMAWMLTSFGLHQLLLYYPERTWAVWAARKKFLISRLGDAMLIAALLLTYSTFGTTEYTGLFAAADAIHEGAAPGSLATTWIGILFVLGAMTKSAQFPFHSWLPDTMETPTPVSALMHAGVINAGGFLVIRLSPLVSLSPISLNLLAVIGAITAVMGSLVMLTQVSIKRSLAYSTIAQMGFMMLQCGLGAFSAALLHIVAHSAYKAHAFLRSGSVLDAAARLKAPAAAPSSSGKTAAALCLSLVMAAGIAFGAFRTIGIDVASKPGGVVLGMILTLALTQLLWTGLASGVTRIALGSVASAVVVTTAYGLAYLVVDRLVASATASHETTSSPLGAVVLVLVVLLFGAGFTIQALSDRMAQRAWLKALYVHAMNGFYIDIPARRLTARFYGQTAPVQ